MMSTLDQLQEAADHLCTLVTLAEPGQDEWDDQVRSTTARLAKLSGWQVSR
jgi:hypothetical protein